MKCEVTPPQAWNCCNEAQGFRIAPEHIYVLGQCLDVT